MLIDLRWEEEPDEWHAEMRGEAVLCGALAVPQLLRGGIILDSLGPHAHAALRDLLLVARELLVTWWCLMLTLCITSPPALQALTGIRAVGRAHLKQTPFTRMLPSSPSLGQPGFLCCATACCMASDPDQAFL